MTAKKNSFTGNMVLSTVEAFLRKFVAYPDEASQIAHTLWIGHTWFMDQWESSPRIAFLSPEPGSGKTRALEVTEPLVPRPIHAVNCTPSYLFRKVSDPNGLPTLLYDEIDTIFGPKAKDNEETRGMLNAGHRRGATAGRCVVRGNNIVTEELPAFCAVALAGLNDLPDTIMTRSVVIRMQRRRCDERVQPWRARICHPQAEPIHELLRDWANRDQNLVAWPEFPPGIEDRNADVWEPLLAVADLAGGGWPDRARRSARTLVGNSSDPTRSLGLSLLSDLRDMFDRECVTKLRTEVVVERLNSMAESQWATVRKGGPVDARWVSQHLKPYGIEPKPLNMGGTTSRGYARQDFEDPWGRYLPVIADTENP